MSSYKDRYYEDDKRHPSRGVSWNEKMCAYTPVIYMVMLLSVIIFLSDLFYHPRLYTSTKPSSQANLQLPASSPEASIANANLRASAENPLVTVPVIPVLPNIKSDSIVAIDRLIVIPGGGGGENGYPEWTKRRVTSAAQYFQGLSTEHKDKTAIVVLSAGSFNTPNAQQSDRRIVFENQHMISNLKELGVPEEKIFGDIFSWDTVTNGLSLRLFLEGLSSYHPSPLPRKSIDVEVFISDFHLKRVEIALSWALGVQPSLLASDKGTSNQNSIQAKLSMHSVGSEGIESLSVEALEERAKHEEKGIEMLLAQMKSIKTFQQYCAFLMLGGHLGIRNYLFNDYTKSSGAGW